MVSLQVIKNTEWSIKDRSDDYKYGFYLGVLGGTNNKKIREYAEKKRKYYGKKLHEVI